MEIAAIVVEVGTALVGSRMGGDSWRKDGVAAAAERGGEHMYGTLPVSATGYA